MSSKTPFSAIPLEFYAGKYGKQSLTSTVKGSIRIYPEWGGGGGGGEKGVNENKKCGLFMVGGL
jgi:hypothetical protein